MHRTVVKILKLHSATMDLGGIWDVPKRTFPPHSNIESPKAWYNMLWLTSRGLSRGDQNAQFFLGTKWGTSDQYIFWRNCNRYTATHSCWYLPLLFLQFTKSDSHNMVPVLTSRIYTEEVKRLLFMWDVSSFISFKMNTFGQLYFWQ